MSARPTSLDRIASALTRRGRDPLCSTLINFALAAGYGVALGIIIALLLWGQ